MFRVVQTREAFAYPEGNVWGVAVKYGSEFDDRGGFIYP